MGVFVVWEGDGEYVLLPSDSDYQGPVRTLGGREMQKAQVIVTRSWETASVVFDEFLDAAFDGSVGVIPAGYRPCKICKTRPVTEGDQECWKCIESAFPAIQVLT